MQDESKALAVTEQPGALALPDDLAQYAGAGNDNVNSDNVRPPRIRICQAGTPERQRGKTPGDNEIAGLSELDFFNDASQAVYGPSIDFVVIRYLGEKFIQFDPDVLGTVIDRNVPKGDPRTKWTESEPDPETGKKTSIKPIATEYNDFLIYLPDTADVGVLSLKSTMLPAAEQIRKFQTLPLRLANGAVVKNPPAWARKVRLTTFLDRDGDLTWSNVKASMLGITPEGERRDAAAIFEHYKAAVIETPIEGEVIEDSAKAVKTEDIPF